MRATLEDLQVYVHDNAKRKGWWDPQANGSGLDPLLVDAKVPESLALIHSELSEALEEVLNGHPSRQTRIVANKPEGFVVELADAAIRMMDLCGALGVSLSAGLRQFIDFSTLDDAQQLIHKASWTQWRLLEENGHLNPHGVDAMIESKIARLHLAVSLALEEYRSGHPTREIRTDGSARKGLVVELAKVLAGILDLCGALGVSLEAAILQKACYNATRPYRHGGKRA